MAIIVAAVVVVAVYAASVVDPVVVVHVDVVSCVFCSHWSKLPDNNLPYHFLCLQILYPLWQVP